MFPLLLLSHDIGVSNAPPKLSSEPRPTWWGATDARLPQDTENGSTPAPLERTTALVGSGTAGGSGKMCAPDVTCTTRSTACR